ncbi:ClpXP adapter SpxH family protein [Enterococcus rotai]|uniref:GTP pyrophosphokinase n=1 Tax=Enterococcus rotai TaxID=118060 RepID=A0A0U2VZ77_9ENTE|nr:ClpXP adapter SpxH family protein [Enterococcus rotai]ALS38628.1 GTP pyrophosphokinase [Enterococcus rotai]
MIEIYLFVNPLGGICLNVEKDILKLVETENKKIQFRFIPLVNMRTINHLIKLFEIPTHDIEQRNQLFEDVYSAALDYKAAQLQGKKKGRHLLLGLQQAVAEENIPYSSELAEKLVVEAGGDLDMFKADRQSDFVKESFQTDQQIAREMGIVKHPSAVVYNYTCDRDFGVLVEDCESMDEIKRLCETSEDNLQYFHEKFELNHFEESRVPHGHLHLL